MKVIKASLLAVSLLVFSTAEAAVDTWDLRGISQMSSKTTNLFRTDKSVYSDISVQNAKLLVDVSDRLSSLAGIRPKLLLQESNEFNAGALFVGGEPVVLLTPKMFKVISQDPDMAAALLGHEFAHLTLNHSSQKKTEAVVGAVIAFIAGTALEIVFQRRLGVVNLGMNLGSLTGDVATTAFSREHESEADTQGIEWAIAAGYNPYGAAKFFSAMQRHSSDPLFSFLSTHPMTGDRIESAKKLAADFLARKEEQANQVKEKALAERRSVEIAANKELARVSALIEEERARSTPRSPEALSGAEAFAAGDFKLAHAKFELCAAASEVACVNNLGVLYERGLGVDADPKLATSYFKKAADQGLALGISNYASAIANGYDGRIDRQKILPMFVDAAAKGSVTAMGNAAYFRQLSGWDKPGIDWPSDATIMAYARASEMRRIPAGAFALGVIHKNGFETHQNFGLAARYFERASSLGDSRADAMLALLYEYDLKNPAEAKKYFERVEKSPTQTSAMVMVTHYCLEEKTKDKNSCFKWSKIGSTTGSPRLMFFYGLSLISGLGGAKNPVEGVAWVYAAHVKGEMLADSVYQANLQSLTPEERRSVETRAADILRSFPGKVVKNDF